MPKTNSAPVSPKAVRQKAPRQAPEAGEAGQARERLVAAARLLFARKGFNGASIRAIADKAGVNSALITYHFGNKEGLFRTVFAEALAPMNAERMASFAALAQAGDYEIEEVVAAWIGPLFDSPLLAGQSSLAGLTLALGGEQAELADQLVSEVYDEINETFLSLLERKLPHVCRETLVHRLFFLVGAVITATRRYASSLRKLSRGKLDGFDQQALQRHLVAFCAAGFKAAEPVEGRPAGSRARGARR